MIGLRGDQRCAVATVVETRHAAYWAAGEIDGATHGVTTDRSESANGASPFKKMTG
jgi:hypothetical protein